MDLGLRDKVCVVTGASRGIGLAVARALAGEGVAVAMVARRAAAHETLTRPATLQQRTKLLADLRELLEMLNRRRT